MLRLRPNCECCNKDLPPESKEALICSFECTFCRSCAETILKAGAQTAVESSFSTASPWGKLQKFPASTERVYKPDGCRQVA